MRNRVSVKCGYVLSSVLLLMIAIASIAWMCCGVEWFDDLQYKRMPGEGIDFWLNEEILITTFSEACEAVPYHFTVGSTRLPNIIQVFFNIVPPAHYWSVVLETGNALYCHNINVYGHSKRHREILSIDKWKGE